MPCLGFPFCSLAHIALSCYVNPISGEITMHALMMIHSGSWQAYIVSRSHHKMSLSEEFPGGITNEASWYGKLRTISHAQELHCCKHSRLSKFALI
jgi:hypothetical protein